MIVRAGDVTVAWAKSVTVVHAIREALTTKNEAQIAAMDIFNSALQREIETCSDDVLALELAQIKFVVNRGFAMRRNTGVQPEPASEATTKP